MSTLVRASQQAESRLCPFCNDFEPLVIYRLRRIQLPLSTLREKQDSSRSCSLLYRGLQKLMELWNEKDERRFTVEIRNLFNLHPSLHVALLIHAYDMYAR
jgi:hypothetical protein